MATNKNNIIFKFIEITYDKLNNQINEWLSIVYNKANLVLDSTSPFGQIKNILQELFQANLVYLKQTLNILNIETTYNKKVIQQIARISGHSVGRAISATGTLKLVLKTGVDINKEIKDSIIIINDKLLLKNITNNLNYVVQLNTERNIYPINKSSTVFYLPIIQGKYETQTFTGDGTYNQSFSVNIPNNAQIENNNIQITYNTLNVTIKEHKYDILKNELACFIRSGFNGGIDIYFGSENNGFVPADGSIINVTYLLSAGSEGEIFNNVENDWKFIEKVTDGQGNLISIEDLFTISIENKINFASDGESIEYTKSIIPYVSRNFVLATPNQFIFHLKKLNMFSKVNAYNKLNDNDFSVNTNDIVIQKKIKKILNDVNNEINKQTIINELNNLLLTYSKYRTNFNDNIIFLYLIPNIKKYFNDNINYFNIPFDVFYLDDDEQNKIINYLKSLGTMAINTDIRIIQPIISRYIIHIFIRRYDYSNEDNIKQEIIALTSDYLLNNDRFDRIPKSDFIQMYKSIDGVDSASVYFVSEKNELYHKQAKDLGYTTQTNIQKDEYGNITGFKQKYQPILQQGKIKKNNKIIENKVYDENNIIGIDKLYGDIIIEQDEYPIIRGGWNDRNGIYYNENPNEMGLSSINITFEGITKT